MDQTRILEKIKKCLALSQSPEPAEAAAALRQAQKLMEMHGISQLDIKRSDIGEVEVSSKVSVSRLKDWELKLVALIGRSFGCQVMWSKSSSYRAVVFGRFILVGPKGQVELAQYTCEVLQRKLVKARANFVSSTAFWGSRAEKTRAADGFCHGWVDSISKTVSEFAQSDGAKEMIMIRVKELTSGPKAQVQRRLGDTASYQAGRDAGANESIHRPLNERDPTLRLGC